MKGEKVTNEDLARMMERGFKDAEIRTDDKIDELARMVAKGFNGVDKRFDKMATKDDLKDLKSEMNTRFEKVDEDLREINMKIHDVDEYSRRHSRRIEKLEENAGIL